MHSRRLCFSLSHSPNPSTPASFNKFLTSTITVLDIYPRIPHEDICTVSRHATTNGAGRVGRVGKLEDTTKAILAVRAHIRHTKTDYEALLKTGTKRESARDKTSQEITNVEYEWGRVPAKTQLPKKSSARSRTTNISRSRARRTTTVRRKPRAKRQGHKK